MVEKKLQVATSNYDNSILKKQVKVALPTGGKATVKLMMWDTVGQEQWARTLASNYFRKTDLAIVMYDVTC